MTGKIEVITGPMFSGKTTELLHRLEKYILADKSYIALKPDKDTRLQNTSIMTIRGMITVHYELVACLDFSVDSDVIVLDEAQFFGPELIRFCQKAKDTGKVVLVSGLDMDYNRKPFGYLCELMAIADSVTKLTAVCACGKDAQYTKKIGGDHTRLVEIGDHCYVPCCTDCYNELNGTKNFDEETANQISNWLNENGFEDASLALDCEFDL